VKPSGKQTAKKSRSGWVSAVVDELIGTDVVPAGVINWPAKAFQVNKKKAIIMTMQLLLLLKGIKTTHPH
jgi:hypothetical protein